MKKWTWSLSLLCVLVVCVGACDDETSGRGDDVVADTATDQVAPGDAEPDESTGDGQSLDTGVDGAVVDTAASDVEPDTEGDGVSASCTFPGPSLASEPAARAVLDDPARCGQTSLSILDDPRLGDVVEQLPKQSLSGAILTAVLAVEGYSPPKPATYNVDVDQLRYMTQDRGQLLEATALVAYPTNMPAGSEADILLFLHGTVGFNDACSPSNDAGAQALAALFASMGYFVVMPDYIGLKGAGDPTGFIHPYLVAWPTVVASLDAARAAGKLPLEARGELCLRPRVAVIGGSQGGHAALWVDRLAAYYAPELELMGVVATVPPSDLLAQVTAALEVVRNSTGNTIAFMPTAGDWYGFSDRLDEVFVSPWDVDVPSSLASSCSPGDAIPSDATLPDLFQQPLLDAAANGTLADIDPWGCLLAENGLTSTSIPRLGADPDSYGILVITGENDELVDTPIERAAVAELCGQGMPIFYLECAGANHVQPTLWALPEIVDFVDARMAGEAIDTSSMCQVGAAVTCAGTP